MNTNIDLKALWQQQPVSQPDIAALLSKLKQYKRTNVRGLVRLNVTLLATCAFIIYIWVRYQPRLITTKLGIVLLIVAMLVFIFSNNRLLPLYKKIDASLSNSEYLQHLIVLKGKQQFLQTTMISLYFVMLSAGLLLYMYEYTSRMSTLWAIVAYALTGAWVAFNWFYTKPKTIKKQQAKLNELINRFTEVAGQLEEA